ncbi:MAG: ATP-binding protein [Pseudomonadota bacterium]
MTTLNALQVNLQRLMIIRVIVFGCQLAALLYARYVMALNLNYAMIMSTLFLLAVINGALYLRLKQDRAPAQLEFFVHLMLDVIGLSLMLYFAGGATSPFVSYFLVPVTIAAATLTSAYTWILTGVSLGCYSLLLYFYQPLPPLMPLAADLHAGMPGMVHEAAPESVNLHILGMWFNFLVSAVLITYFVTQMAAEIRKQETRLGRYREDTLRNEQILAVATQAAGTAHTLGTPLGTMAILLKEMQRGYASQPELLAEVQLLQQQVVTCRDALKELVQIADFKNRQTIDIPLVIFIHTLADQWQLIRPEISCTLHVAQGDAPLVEVDNMLQQALINILNNAADASPQGITVSLSWSASQWTLQIRDFGAGISRELSEQLGTRIVSTKESGMGVGLVLSQATINRLGGSVSIYPHAKGGSLTEVIIPFHLDAAVHAE